MRVGIGYDIHQFAEGRRLILGGVEIPSEKGLIGHSDADVLSHAIADAILGAAGLGDIGYYFPNNDPSIEGISSLEILRKAVSLAGENDWYLENVDASLIMEAPKIAPYVGAMKKCIAEALGVSVRNVGIKATTNETLGAIGRGEGVAAMAVALLKDK